MKNNTVVGELNNDDDDAHQNEGNVGQVSDLFDEERGPEFDTTLTP